MNEAKSAKKLLKRLFWVALGWASALSLELPARAADSTYLYLLSNPFETAVELSAGEKVTKFAVEWGIEASKVAFGYSVGGLSGMGWNLVSIIMTRKRAKAPRDFSDGMDGIPGLRRIYMLSARNIEVESDLLRRRTSRGLVFLETESPLPDSVVENPDWKPEWGNPLRIRDRDAAHVRVELGYADQVHELAWEPSIREVFEGKTFPSEVLMHWHAALMPIRSEPSVGRWMRGLDPMRRLFERWDDRSVRLDIQLVGEDGQEIPIGTMASGRAARKLIGDTFLSKVKRFVNEQMAEGYIYEGESLPINEKRVWQRSENAAPGAAECLQRVFGEARAI